jgi:hypothetical protein
VQSHLLDSCELHHREYSNNRCAPGDPRITYPAPRKFLRGGEVLNEPAITPLPPAERSRAGVGCRRPGARLVADDIDFEGRGHGFELREIRIGAGTLRNEAEESAKSAPRRKTRRSCGPPPNSSAERSRRRAARRDEMPRRLPNGDCGEVARRVRSLPRKQFLSIARLAVLGILDLQPRRERRHVVRTRYSEPVLDQ